MAERIASLLPSATEILCALGLADRIVGVSHECDFPPEVVGRAVLTEPKLELPRPAALDARRSPEAGSGDEPPTTTDEIRAATSVDIDTAVRRLVRDGLSVYRIRAAELRAARPDLIVTQDQCEVCAVSFSEVEQAVRALLDPLPAIVSLQPNRLDDVLDDFARVAQAAGVGDAGARLIADSRARLERIGAMLRHARSRPRVACIEWLDPLMVAGNWVPELVQLSGGTYALVEAGALSTAIAWADLVAAAPDVVILMPCGFRLEQTRRELPQLTARREWQALPAVRNRRVYSVDGNAYLNRPGPRLIDSAELLAGLIQPGHCAALIPPHSWEPVGQPATS